MKKTSDPSDNLLAATFENQRGGWHLEGVADGDGDAIDDHLAHRAFRRQTHTAEQLIAELAVQPLHCQARQFITMPGIYGYR